MTELDIYRGSSLTDRMTYTRALSAAQGVLPSTVSGGPPEVIAARTFFITETGDMLGIHPLAALAGVNVIDGKPSLAPALMSALIRRAGHKIRVYKSGSVAAGDYQTRVEITRADDPDFTHSASWDVHRAVRAGLCSYAPDQNGVWVVSAQGRNGGAKPWQAYTESMVYARSLSECAREAAEDVLFGVHYTPEELGADVDADGNLLAEFEQQQQTQQQPAASAMPPQHRQAAQGRQGVRKPPSAPAPEQQPASAPSAPEPSAPSAEDMAQQTLDEAADEGRAAVLDEPVYAEVVPDEEPTPDADPSTGEIPDGAAPNPYEVAVAEEPENFDRHIEAATSIDELQEVWHTAGPAGVLTDSRKRRITERVAALRDAQA